jgi:hypothetical protein
VFAVLYAGHHLDWRGIAAIAMTAFACYLVGRPDGERTVPAPLPLPLAVAPVFTPNDEMIALRQRNARQADTVTKYLMELARTNRALVRRKKQVQRQRAALIQHRIALRAAPIPVRESRLKGDEWHERYEQWWHRCASEAVLTNGARSNVQLGYRTDAEGKLIEVTHASVAAMRPKKAL